LKKNGICRCLFSCRNQAEITRSDHQNKIFLAGSRIKPLESIPDEETEAVALETKSQKRIMRQGVLTLSHTQTGNPRSNAIQHTYRTRGVGAGALGRGQRQWQWRDPGSRPP